MNIVYMNGRATWQILGQERMATIIVTNIVLALVIQSFVGLIAGRRDGQHL
jgi:hypothetical protein